MASYFKGVRGATRFVAGLTNHVGGLRAIAADTLVIEMERPDPTFGYLLATQGIALPREEIARLGRRYGSEPVANGPYRVAEWKRGARVRLRANPFYHGVEPRHFEEIDFFIGGDETTHLMMFERGELDLANIGGTGIPFPSFRRLRDDPRWHDLLESERFGHERGAFTGATAMRRGRFEQAEGGTLFLDEIGDMPAELQTRLLRVLSDGNFYRVGGHQPIKANVRVIAATHQDLDERVRQGLFREDLFHRLNVIRLRLPPLRERREDIPLLVKHFLAKSAQDLGVEPKRVSEAALKFLSALVFPGNVRQLENLCHWLTVMAPGQVIEIADLPPELRAQAPRETEADWKVALGAEADRMLAARPGVVWDSLTRDFEKTLIRHALLATAGRRIEAAQMLGIGRNTITRKIHELGMDNDEGEREPPESVER